MNGYFTTHLFDPVGRAIALVDANSHRTTSLFNGRGDLLSTQDPLGAFTSWQYDGVGNTVLRTDARFPLSACLRFAARQRTRPTSYTLDALNRTVGQIYLDGTRVTNTFDPARQ